MMVFELLIYGCVSTAALSPANHSGCAWRSAETVYSSRAWCEADGSAAAGKSLFGDATVMVLDHRCVIREEDLR